MADRRLQPLLGYWRYARECLRIRWIVRVPDTGCPRDGHRNGAQDGVSHPGLSSLCLRELHLEFRIVHALGLFVQFCAPGLRATDRISGISSRIDSTRPAIR